MEMLDSVLTSPPSAEQKKTRPAGLQRRANRVCEVTRPDTKRIIRGQPGHWFCEHNQLRLILTRRNRNSNNRRREESGESYVGDGILHRPIELCQWGWAKREK